MTAVVFTTPDPPTLAFWDFLAFFVFRFPLLFWPFFFSFPRILGVPRREKPLFFSGFPLLSPKMQGLEVLSLKNETRKLDIFQVASNVSLVAEAGCKRRAQACGNSFYES